MSTDKTKMELHDLSEQQLRRLLTGHVVKPDKNTLVWIERARSGTESGELDYGIDCFALARLDKPDAEELIRLLERVTASVKRQLKDRL
jgi:hypothetical protein